MLGHVHRHPGWHVACGPQVGHMRSFRAVAVGLVTMAPPHSHVSLPHSGSHFTVRPSAGSALPPRRCLWARSLCRWLQVISSQHTTQGTHWETSLGYSYLCKCPSFPGFLFSLSLPPPSLHLKPFAVIFLRHVLCTGPRYAPKHARLSAYSLATPADLREERAVLHSP